jgi:aminoglycoside phosphotransferase (APT) family kinase protein
MMEAELGRCVASWCPGATGVTGAAKLSGGASQETWSFDILHPDGNIGAILRRAPPGVGAAPSRAAGLAAEAQLMQLAHDAGVPSPRVLHVLQPQDGLGTGFIMQRVEGETIAQNSARREVCEGPSAAGAPTRQGRGRHPRIAAGETAKTSADDGDHGNRRARTRLPQF